MKLEKFEKKKELAFYLYKTSRNNEKQAKWTLKDFYEEFNTVKIWNAKETFRLVDYMTYTAKYE